MGFFEKLKQGLSKTSKNITSKIDSVLAAFGKIDEDLFEELEEEFPEYFGQQDEEEEDKDTKKDRGGYRPGPKQKGNPPKKKDKYELGKSAYQRIRGKNNKEG